MHTGKHAMIDLYWELDAPITRDPDILMEMMKTAVVAEGATILHEHTNPFSGGGYTGMLLLAESHASIHTWPEHGQATLDIYMCGECDAFKALDSVVENLKDTENAPISRFETKLFRGFILPRDDDESAE